MDGNIKNIHYLCMDGNIKTFIIMIMNNKMSNWDLKVKFDTAFDKIFFSNDFKNAMLNKFGIAPAGMTLDTRYDDDVSEIYFVLVSKSYGYEYSGERVVGDYSLNKFEFSREMFDFAIDYLSMNARELWAEIINYEFAY